MRPGRIRVVVMSFDYIFDTFGKLRNRKTRFTELENEATKLISGFVNGTLDDREFATSFEKVRCRFIELMNKNGEIVFDKDTPLWLNSFIGLHYIDWYRYQQVKWYIEQNPEELRGEIQERFGRIQKMNYDEQFTKICQDVLKELKS